MMFQKMNLLIAMVVLVGFVFVKNAENLEIIRRRRDVPSSELFPETKLQNFTSQMQVLAGGLLSFNSTLIIGELYDTELPKESWLAPPGERWPRQRFIQVYENCKVGVVKIEADYDNIHSCSDPDKHSCKLQFQAKFGHSSTTTDGFTVGAKISPIKDVLEFSGEYSRTWAEQVSQENTKTMDITYSNGQIVLPIQIFGGLSCDVRVFEVRSQCRRSSKCEEGIYENEPYCRKRVIEVSKDEEMPCLDTHPHEHYYCHTWGYRHDFPNYKNTASRSVRCFYRASDNIIYEALQSDCCIGDNSCYSEFGKPKDIDHFPGAACKRTDIPLLNSKGSPLKITMGYVYSKQN